MGASNVENSQSHEYAKETIEMDTMHACETENSQNCEYTEMRTENIEQEGIYTEITPSS